MRVRARCVRGRAKVAAHQLSHTPQVDSIFNVPAGKDSLCADLYVANDYGYRHFNIVTCIADAPNADYERMTS